MTAIVEKKELYELGVEEMAAGIASGEISVIELAETLLARIKKYDGVLQSFSYMDVEGVMNEAKELDDEAKAGKFRGPLHGVPFGIKEQFLLKGVPTRGDWKDANSPVAEYDATQAVRLRAAGGLLMGKLFMTGPSGTPPTRNPWNPEYSPGGSSSGSGAAVGARFVPFTMSEQTAGSGIRPAAYNGVAGFKATYGRNSRFGMFQMAYSHDHACIIAPSIPDVAKVFRSTSGYDPLDPSSLNLPPSEVAIDVANTRPPKIGIVRNFFPELQQDEMNAAIDAAAKKLADAGATVVDMTLPEEFGMAWPNWMLVMGCEQTVIHANEDGATLRAGKEIPFGPMKAVTFQTKFMGLSRAVTPLIPATYYLHAQRVRRWLRAKVDETLGEYDAVMMATAPGAAPKGLETSGDPTLLIPWSHLGNPTTSIPGGLNSEGMPLGLQLAAPNLADDALLQTSAWCENVIGRLPAPELKA